MQIYLISFTYKNFPQIIYIILTFQLQMKKQLFKMTDTDIKKLVEECTNRVLKEHMQSSLSRDLLEAINQLGAEGFVDMLCNELPIQDIQNIILASYKYIAKKNGTYDEAYGEGEGYNDHSYADILR